MPSFGLASFHAQQAVEKAIKAVLVRHGRPFEKTHDLGRLLRQAEAVEPEIERKVGEVDVLTPFAVIGRYPMMTTPTSREAASAHLAAARTALSAISEALGGYLGGAGSAT